MSEKPFEPSPYLSDDLNKKIVESQLQGGANINQLAPGHVLVVQTRNTQYQICREKNGELLIRGNAKYCPDWTKCYVHGSTFGGSMLKMGFVGRGMYMEFSTEHHHQELQ